MSVESLLTPETKNENWSNLFCNTLNVANLLVDNFQGNIILNNVLGQSSFTVNSGTGLVNNIESIVSVQKTENNSRFVTISANFQFSGMTAPVTLGTSLFQFTLTPPFTDNVIYPSGLGQGIPGSISAVCNEATGANYMTTSQAYYVTGTQILFRIVIGADVSSSLPNRTFKVAFNITYQVA